MGGQEVKGAEWRKQRGCGRYWSCAGSKGRILRGPSWWNSLAMQKYGLGTKKRRVSKGEQEPKQYGNVGGKVRT